MLTPATHVGVQSWCFRNFKPVDALIEQIKKIGLSRVEICGIHVSFDDEKTWDPLISACKKAGIQITSLGVEAFGNDPAREEKRFQFAKAAGASMISATFRIDTVPAAYRTAEKLADKYDLVLGVHNHGGYDWLGSRTALAHLFKNTSARIGLCMDTAWALQAGEDPLKMAEQFADRLYGLHIKDFVFNPKGRWEDVIVGTGALDLKQLLALTTGTGKFASKMRCLTLEYEGDVENPGPKLAECVAAVKKAS